MQINSSSEYGNVEEKVPVEKEGEDLKIGFNSKYLLDFLRVEGNEKIEFKFVGKNNPCFISEEGKQDYIYMVLPVRISWEDDTNFWFCDSYLYAYNWKFNFLDRFFSRGGSHGGNIHWYRIY